MFNKLIELYSRGDMDTLSSSILHSSSWKQHDFTAFGNMQIEKLWLKSLEQFGFSTVIKKQIVAAEQFSTIYLELLNEQTNQDVALSFFLEHNNIHIKRIHCIVDTVKLAHLLNKTPTQMIAELPSPDPLLLSQFDHQKHPQSYHATPADICNMPKKIEHIIGQWWSILQDKQFTNFETIYHKDAEINIAGFDTKQNYAALRKFQLKLHNRINRNYCQLEQMCFDEKQGTVGILWHMDGDYIESDAVKRVRIPVISLLRLNEELIVEETFQVDWLALCRSFNLPYPIVCTA